MDKYTVDLDQVLNDFEYSELTDQHGFDKNKPNNKQNSHASYVHNFKNSNIKHSINNVFHSLNEYLNTDISPKNEFKPIVQDPCISGENSRSQNVHSDFSEEVHNEGVNHEMVDTQNNATIPVGNIIDASVSLEKEIIVVSEPVENATVTLQPSLIEKLEEIVTQKDEVALNETIDESIKEKTEITSANSVNHENFINEHIEIESECEEELDAEIIESETKTEEVEVKITETETKKEEEFETQTKGVLLKKEELDETINELETKNTELESSTEDVAEHKTEDDGVITVGFDDDDLDLDDSELNQYLDEFEKEYESKLEHEEQETKIEETKDNESKEGVIVNMETTQDSSENVATLRPNNLPLSDQASEEAKGVIDLVGEPGSTPYNNVYVNKELPQEKQKDNSDTECSTSASPTFSDISTETNSSCTPSTDTANDDNQNGGIDEGSKSDDTVVEAITKENTSEQEAVVDVKSEGAGDGNEPQNEEATASATAPWLGKQAPVWIPDADAPNCMHCDMKFTVIKRRHHCRACGYVLCSKCCNIRFRLEYLEEVARVCNKCFEILSKDAPGTLNSSGSESNSPHFSQPNPNNPLEYCSTLPPHQQVSGNINPPAVMVPVGVLKRKGSNKTRTNKSVMFCDGIRPGSDLTNLDNDFTYSEKNETKVENPVVKVNEKSYSIIDAETKSFIPKGDDLPPTVTIVKTDISYSECSNGPHVVEMLKNETLIFSLQTNLLVHVKIINMDCCINKLAWCFSTEGLISVGQDEIMILLELLDDEKSVPKDIFLHINHIFLDALKGTSVKEMDLSLHQTSNFLGSKNHAGFVYIRPTFQCLQNVIKPQEPYLIGVLIHRWETPWAKLFPLRLILRLGAEYRYYPSPIISNRYRDSVFVEIGHTIINLLADFRNFSYTLPQIRGLAIHMEDKNTTVTIPSNRYDQVMKSMNNSSDHILAFAGNFSSQADSHLVCIQDTESNENAYSTHAINIHNKPRKVTGASFIVFNGALKSSSGLTAKSSIVEDGLMIQIPSEQMVLVRESLRNMKNFTIQCGCINAASDETVNITWGEADVNFNINVFSPIDNKSMEGIPSIRVHNGKDYINGSRLIRWTEVFIIQNEGESLRNQDPIDISKVSETIAKATCTALVKYLDLLASNSFYKIGIRANLNAFFVAYSAGSNATILPPIYMESLDNELVPVLHRNATSDCDENTIILELIFHILNK